MEEQTSIKICDFHVHVGHFNEGMFCSPEMLVGDMKSTGVSKWVFSSTSTGQHPFDSIKKEIEKTVALSNGDALPFLWVTPEMLKESQDLSKFFFTKFYGIKIHGYNGWSPNGVELHGVFEIAQARSLPVLLHTGGSPDRDAGAYLKICEKFKNVTVILAHGRPIDQTVSVMSICPNVYADTAFMPLKDLKQLKNIGLLNRVLFGTDYPITSYFYKTPRRTYYRRRLQSIKNTIGTENFIKMSSLDMLKSIINYPVM